MAKSHSSFFGTQRTVTFDSEGVRLKTRYLESSTLSGDSIFEGFGANGAKEMGENPHCLKKLRFFAKNAHLIDLAIPRVRRE